MVVGSLAETVTGLENLPRNLPIAEVATTGAASKSNSSPAFPIAFEGEVVTCGAD